MKRHEIGDKQWAIIEKRLPKRNGRLLVCGDRNFINAVIWIANTGDPWRDLPERFGPWKSVFNRFSNWSLKGHWKSIIDALALNTADRAALIDGTVIRAHRDIFGGRGGPKKTP